MRNEPSRTAEMVCLFRAAERLRQGSDRVLDDPYARWFLGPMVRAALATFEATGRLGRLAQDHVPGLAPYIVARHRFIDDRLTKALERDAEQVVILGAGYDTRAYRLADRLAGRRVYELDFPATSRRKVEIVDAHAKSLPNANVVRVEIDFLTQTVEDALASAGYEVGRPTFFIWEGVSMYLTRAAVKDTITTLRRLGGPKSQVAMDYWFLLDSGDFMSTMRRLSPNLLYFLGEPITFGIHPEDVVPFMERLGFVVDDLADGTDLQMRYLGDGRKAYPACYVLSGSVRSA